MNRIDWLIATGGNPCFELAALGPLLSGLVGETAAGIIGPALIGGAETAAGGAALGGITGGGQGALRGAEIGGLTGAGIFGGGPAAAAAGLPATVGTTAGGALGGTLGGVATGENPLLTGAAGGIGGFGAGLSGVASGTAPTAPAAASTAMTPTPGAGPAAATTAIPGIGDGGSYSNILGPQGGLRGPSGNNPVVQTDVGTDPGGLGYLGAGAGGSSPTGTQLAGAPTPLTPPADPGGAIGGTQPFDGGAGAGTPAPVGNPGTTTAGTGADANPDLLLNTQVGPGIMSADPTVTSSPEGGTWQGIKNFLGNPSGLQLAGAGASGIGLLMSGLRGNQYAGLENQIRQQATNAAGTTTALQSPLFTGIMPPGVQSSIDQQKKDAAAAIRSGYARAGMPGSTTEAEQIAASNARIDAQKIGIEQDMFSKAATYAGMPVTDLRQLYDIQNQQDQNFQRSLASFVAALAGGRSGTTQTTQTS